MSKRHKKKCQKSDRVSVKLGQFFETMDSFSETGLKLSTVSAQIDKIGYYRVKEKNFSSNQCKKVKKLEEKNHNFVQICGKKMKI